MNDKRKTDTKERIITLTVKEIQKSDYQSLSQRGLAKKIGVSSTAFYRHFESKENLMDEALLRVSGLVFEKYKKTQKKGEAPSNSLDEFLGLSEYILTMFVEEPLMMNFLFFSPSAVKVYASMDFSVPFWAEALRIIGAMKEEYELSADIETLYTKLWAYVQGYTMLIVYNIVPYDKDLLKTGIRALLFGEK